MISIIIPTIGLTPSLRATVSSLCKHVGTSTAELIVVVNGPDMAFSDKLESPPGLSISVIHERTPGLLAGRHRGVVEASGDILVFVDDDIDVTPTWLDALHDAFDDSSVALVGGPSIPNYECETPEWLDQFWGTTADGIRSCAYLSLLDAGESRRTISPYFVWGLNFAIRRHVLIELGGFHPDGVPWKLRMFRGDGETGVARKLAARGLTAIYDPRAAVRHRVPAKRLTIEYFERRSFLQGVSDSYTAIRGPSGSSPEASIRQTRSIWRRVVGPVKRLLTGGRAVGRPSAEKKRVHEAYDHGFAFHQAKVAADPNLRAWVNRKTYWDYTYPEQVRHDY